MAGTPGAAVALATRVRSSSGREFTWRFSAKADDSGRFTACVPYPGDALVSVGELQLAVTVDERAIAEGRTVDVGPHAAP